MMKKKIICILFLLILMVGCNEYNVVCYKEKGDNFEITEITVFAMNAEDAQTRGLRDCQRKLNDIYVRVE